MSLLPQPEGERTSLEGLVDVDRLREWMDDQDGLPGRGEPLEVKRVSSGASNDIFELHRGGEVLMLRRPPRTPRERSNEIMMREARVLGALDGTDVPHARLYASCDDTDVLGATFYIMGRIDGFTPMGELPSPFGDDAALRREMGFQLIEAAARLGNVDYQAAGLEGFGKPDGFHERQVDRWLSHLEGYQSLDGYDGRDIVGLEEVAEWLRAHLPQTWEPGIIHGDYQFANVMFDHAEPVRLVAIVDWEMSTVGDPLLDLGWVLCTWRNPGEAGQENAYTRPWDGFPSREELVERYTEVSTRPVGDLDYYTILAGFKLAVMLEGHWAREVAGVLGTGLGQTMRDTTDRLIQEAAERVRGERPSV